MPDHPRPLEPRSRPWIWIVYVLLFGASVPWYLPPGSPPRIWLGLPHWVVIALAAYLAVAVFTAWVVARYWPAGDATAEHGPADDAPATDPANEPLAGGATAGGATAGGATAGRAAAGGPEAGGKMAGGAVRGGRAAGGATAGGATAGRATVGGPEAGGAPHDAGDDA